MIITIIHNNLKLDLNMVNNLDILFIWNKESLPFVNVLTDTTITCTSFWRISTNSIHYLIDNYMIFCPPHIWKILLTLLAEILRNVLLINFLINLSLWILLRNWKHLCYIFEKNLSLPTWWARYNPLIAFPGITLLFSNRSFGVIFWLKKIYRLI